MPGNIKFFAAAGLAAGIALWLMLRGECECQLAPLAGAAKLPAGVLVLMGVALGLAAALVVNLMLPPPRERIQGADGSWLELKKDYPLRRYDLRTVTIPTVVGAASTLLVLAVAEEQIDALPAALALICGSLTLLAASYTLEALARNEAVEMSSHWGGLGGALGGWRLSRLTTLLLLTLALLGATVTVGLSDDENERNSADANTQQAVDADPDELSANVADGKETAGDAAASSGNMANAAQANGAGSR